MFRYNKKIDDWSHEKIKGIDKIWEISVPLQQAGNKSQTLDYLREYLSVYMRKNGKKIINRLNLICEQKNALNDFNFFLNTTPFSLHNFQKKFISIGTFHQFNKYPTIIIHELLHIFFYQQICDNEDLKRKLHTILSEDDLNTLKEVITVLIDEEFSDFIDVSDTGYPEHEKIREKVLKLWRKKMCFSDFIWQSALQMKKGKQ